jgi:hypothetical protein
MIIDNKVETIYIWDPVEHQYHPEIVPEGMIVKTFSEDMDDVINCAHCHRRMAYGDGYCSHIYQAKHGFGYSVCGQCYQDEMQAELSARKLQA